MPAGGDLLPEHLQRSQHAGVLSKLAGVLRGRSPVQRAHTELRGRVLRDVGPTDASPCTGKSREERFSWPRALRSGPRGGSSALPSHQQRAIPYPSWNAAVGGRAIQSHALARGQDGCSDGKLLTSLAIYPHLLLQGTHLEAKRTGVPRHSRRPNDHVVQIRIFLTINTEVPPYADLQEHAMLVVRQHARST